MEMSDLGRILEEKKDTRCGQRKSESMMSFS